PRLRIEPVRADAGWPLVVRADREPDVEMELVQELTEVGDADVDGPVSPVAHLSPEKHHLHVRPCLPPHLHDAPRTDARADVLLKAGLLPGERPHSARAGAACMVTL